MNLPDNHKRVSLTPQVSLELAIEASNTEDNEDGNGSSVVARTPAASGANESNFNLVYDDFNLASVSMPLQFYFYLFILISFHFRLGCVPLDCLFACLIFRSCYSFPPSLPFSFRARESFSRAPVPPVVVVECESPPFHPEKESRSSSMSAK